MQDTAPVEAVPTRPLADSPKACLWEMRRGKCGFSLTDKRGFVTDMHLISLGLRFFWDSCRQAGLRVRDLIPKWKLSFHFGIKCMHAFPGLKPLPCDGPCFRGLIAGASSSWDLRAEFLPRGFLRWMVGQKFERRAIRICLGPDSGRSLAMRSAPPKTGAQKCRFVCAQDGGF